MLKKKMLEHYKNVIENRSFAEYDILGFLIFIRRHLNKDNVYIREFADLIAHRERDRGIVVDCITASIEKRDICIEGVCEKTRREILLGRAAVYSWWASWFPS